MVGLSSASSLFLFPVLFTPFLPLPIPPQSVPGHCDISLLLEFTPVVVGLTHIGSPTYGNKPKMETKEAGKPEAVSNHHPRFPTPLNLDFPISKMGDNIGQRQKLNN